MKRRRFLGRSEAAGMALTGAKALKPVIAAPATQAQPAHLPSKFIRTADREHVRRFLLGDSGEYGKEHNLRYAERFYYTDQRPRAKAEVDEYVEKNAVSI